MDLENYIVEGKLAIIVKPSSPKTKMVGWDGTSLRLDVKGVPEKGRANTEVVKFFSKLLKKKVEIISGAKSRKKVLKFS